MLIAAILDDSSKLLHALPIVRTSDFSQAALAQCWNWFETMHSENARISLYSVRQRYGREPYFPAVESLVAQAEGVVPGHVVEYALATVDRSRIRQTAVALERLMKATESAPTYDAIRPQIESLFLDSCSDDSAKGFRSAAQITDDLKERLRTHTPAPTIRTGFPTLDAMLKGGFRPGQLVIVGGRTGGGKTVLAMNLAVQMASDGTPSAAFSLEMSDVDLVTRCVLSESGNRTPEEAMERVAALPLYVDDTSNITAKGICSKIRLMHLRKGVKLFAVDYLQLLGVDQGNRDNRERQVAEMSRTLKVTAKSLGLTIIALSQLNEAGELRESRAVEQDADAVLYVIDNDKDEWFLRLVKNRGGANHGPIKRMDAKNPGIPVRFDKPNFRMWEPSRY